MSEIVLNISNDLKTTVNFKGECKHHNNLRKSLFAETPEMVNVLEMDLRRL